MPDLGIHLLQLYLPLIGWTVLGWLLSYVLPKSAPVQLGKFLFWVGVPVSIVTFLRQTDLSGAIWIAPIVAWGAMLSGAGLGWLLLKQPLGLLPERSHWGKPTQGSFLLASMLGNTGYLGYPVTLTLVGTQYFSWALFYDLLGTTLGSYGLGVLLAARFGTGDQSYRALALAIVNNPALWSFGLGLIGRTIALPHPIEQGLSLIAWSAIALSLMLIGMRLSQLSSWRNLQPAAMSLGIKMLLVPLMLGMGLSALGVRGVPQLVIVLQMAMPPAFATLVLAEVYDLDHDLTVTALALGSLGLVILLPVWLWLFSGG